MVGASGTRGRAERLVLLGAALALAICGCASESGAPDLEEFLRGELLPYRLVTKADFRAKTSSSPWGNVAHGAEICTFIVLAPDHDRTGAFHAVMNRDCSFWNRITGPLGFFGRIVAILTGVPVIVPVKQPDWYVLQHEQIHFAINEVAARQLSRELEALAPSRRTDARVESAYRLTLTHIGRRHRRFDAETSGRYDPTGLEKWVRVLEIQMKRLCDDGLECRVRNAGA